ncbi:hypothetical protein TIFTF001_021698 [Ficus carica]|uniref:Uncharacterized protein n=1 Tax=Ficus carica TaxID=3494 RepID=A0AA88AAZ4_FICCA|nr:hypothetical protein TIFTF001_021698 [Ficus carica]
MGENPCRETTAKPWSQRRIGGADDAKSWRPHGSHRKIQYTTHSRDPSSRRSKVVRPTTSRRRTPSLPPDLCDPQWITQLRRSPPPAKYGVREPGVSSEPKAMMRKEKNSPEKPSIMSLRSSLRLWFSWVLVTLASLGRIRVVLGLRRWSAFGRCNESWPPFIMEQQPSPALLRPCHLR